MEFSKEATSYLNNCSNRSVYSFYLSGHGLEIGPLAWPLSLPEGASCHYVDIHPTEELKRIYKEHRNLIVPVDIIDDGEKLESFSECSQDFIIANHVLEHAVNAIRSLMRWYNVLKTEGVLFLSLPDWRFTADCVRKRTPMEHLREDFEQNVTEPSDEHCADHLFAWNGIPRDRVDSSMIKQCKTDGVHNHCWECEDILQLFQILFDDMEAKFRLLDLSLPKGLYNEFILVLQKSPSAKDFWTEFVRRKYIQEKEMEERILSMLKSFEI